MAKDYKNKKGATGKKYTTVGDVIKVTYTDGSTRVVRPSDKTYAATKRDMEKDIGAKKWYKPAGKSKTTAETAVGKGVTDGVVTTAKQKQQNQQYSQTMQKRRAQEAQQKAVTEVAKKEGYNTKPVQKVNTTKKNNNLADALRYGAQTGANNAISGVKTGVLGVSRTVADVVGADNLENDLAHQLRLASAKQQLEQQRINSQYNTNFGGAAKIASDVTAGAVGMLPTIGSFVLTPQGKIAAAGKAAQLGAKAIGFAPLALQAYGGGNNQALNEGATIDQANQYGLGNMAKELGTEVLFGGITHVPGFKNLGDVAANMVKGEVAKKIAGAAGKMAGEGIEEAAAEIADPFIKNATYTEDEEINWGDVAYSGLVGGLTAGALNTGIKGVETGVKVLPTPAKVIQNNQNRAFEALHGQKMMENQAQNVQKPQVKPQQAQDGSASKYLPRPEKPAQNQNMKADFQQNAGKKIQNPEMVKNTPKITLEMSERTFENVGDKKVKAYQQENPAVKPFYQKTADNLLADLQEGIKGGRDAGVDPETRNVTTMGGWQRQQSEPIEQMLRDGMTYSQIEDGLQRIVEDHGKENTANAKRAELYIDDAVRKGYRSVVEGDVSADRAFAYRGKSRDELQQIMEQLDNSFTGNAEQDAAIISEMEIVQNLLDGMQQKQGTVRNSRTVAENTTVESEPSVEESSEHDRMADYEDVNLNQLPKDVLDFWGKATAKSGLDIRIVNGLSDNVNGMYRDGMIYLNANRVNDIATIRTVTAHEVYHAMKNTSEFRNLQDVALDFYRTINPNLTNADLARAKIEEYSSEGVQLTEDEAFEELAADFMELALSEPKVAERIWREQPTLAQRILEFIQNVLQSFQNRKLSALEREQQQLLTKAQRMYSEGLQSMKYQGQTSETGETRYMFAGVNSKTADREALARAQQMEADGVDMETIRQQTGWFKSIVTGNKWAYEISDKGVQFDRNAPRNPAEVEVAEIKKQMGEALASGDFEKFSELNARLKELPVDSAPRRDVLGDWLAHPELYEAYPQLKEMQYEFDETLNANGRYNRDGKITVNADLGNLYPGGIPSNAAIDKLTGTTLHEIQHAIQQIEGFPNGSNPKYWDMVMEDYNETQQNMKHNLDLYLKDIGFKEFVAEQLARVQNKELDILQYWEELEAFKKNSVHGETIERLEKEIAEHKNKRSNYLRAFSPEATRLAKEKNDAFRKFPYELQNLIRLHSASSKAGDYDESAAYYEQIEDFVAQHEEYAELWDKYNDADWDLFGVLRDLDSQMADDLYKNTAGEIMSRDTAQRKILDADQRRQKQPVMGDGNTVYAEGGDGYRKVNDSTRYSLSKDNTGKQLTEQQEQYFKNSKVRDENGNLKKVYHGSPNEFYEFDWAKVGKNGTQEGRGFYFTDDKSISENYGTEGGGGVREFYLKMEKPLNGLKVTMKKAEVKKLLKETDKFMKKHFDDEYFLSNYGDTDYYGKEKVINDTVNNLFEYNNSDSDILYDIINTAGIRDNEDTAAFMKFITEKFGYDGILTEWSNWETGEVSRIYVTFDSNNAKLTDNENPTGSPDIRYSTGSIGGGKSRYQEMVDRYGSIEPGENPNGTNRDVKVPKQTSDWDKTRQWTRTAMEAEQVDDITTGMIAADLVDDMQSGRFIYEPTSNREQVDRANRLINQTGWEQQKEQFWNKYRSGESMTADDIALGERLIQEAQKAGDYQTAVDLIADVAAIGTEAGRSVQALRILKRLTPEGQVMALKRIEQRINGSLAAQKKEPVALPEGLAEEMLQARGPEKQAEIWDKAIQELANQVPATLADKINAWRYLAMLSNPKTHIRNIFGNGVMLGVNALKRAPQALLEKALLQPDNRLTTLNMAVPKEYREFAKWDFDNNAKQMLKAGGGRYNDEIGLISQNKQIFKTPVLEDARKFNSDRLEKEDMWFKKRTYINAMARYMYANGLSPSVMQSKGGNATYEKAQNYAVGEALRATYQEASKVAQKLSEIENLNTDNKAANTAAKVAMGALIPFKKTPINILKRGIEFSPVGMINGLSKAMFDVRKGTATPAEAIDTFTSGLTGTGIAILGYFMAAQGLLSAGADDDDQRKARYDQQMGSQNYAWVFPDGSTYTIDWLAPSVMPLMAGAEFYKQMNEKNPDDENSDAFTRGLEALSRVANPIMEMSMLQGLTEALQSYNSGGQFLSEFATTTASNFGGQFIPAPLGALARTVDDTVRSSYASKENGAVAKSGESFLRQQANKLPGVSMTMQPSIDVWGNERKRQGDNVAMRAFHNFLNPGTYSGNKRTELDNKLNELYENTGESTVLPKTADSSFKYEGKTYYMSPLEYAKYSKTRGQNAEKYVSNFVNGVWYNSINDEDKADIIADLYDLANYQAKKEMLKGRGITYTNDTYEKVLSSGTDAGNYYGTRKQLHNVFDYETSAQVLSELQNLGLSPEKFVKASKMAATTYADKNAKGNPISGSKKEKVIANCLKMGFTQEQAKYVYDMQEESRIIINKWNNV